MFIIMGNIPYDLLWNSLINSMDYKLVIINLMSSVTGYTNVYQKTKLFRIWISWEPLVFVWHPDTVEKILSNNFLLEKSTQYRFLHPWLGTGLLTSDGQKWRTRRKMLVPAFHFKILHDFIPVFNEQSKILIERLRYVARQKCSNCTIVDIVPIITACTLDIICETIMGVSIGAQKSTNNKYCKSVNEVGECFIERLMQPQYWLDQIYYRSESGQKFATNLVKLHEFTRKVIRNRKAQLLNCNKTIRYKPNANGQAEIEQEEKDHRKAFLDLLLDHHINSNGETMTEEDIREEVDTFMFEGHDTTAMALSWILFMLGHHPEIQARAAAEIDSVFDDIIDDNEHQQQQLNSLVDHTNDYRSSSTTSSMINNHNDNFDDNILLTLDKIKSLKYLECCIKEGLRLFPSVPFIGRRSHEDLKLNGYHVPKGTIIFVYIYMLHRDPDVFTDPEKFDPDRFLQENAAGRHPFAFVPFSAGPRNCIGQRFAMSELKVVLAYLLRYFRFESIDERDKIFAMMEMVYRPKSPLRLRVYERRKAEVFEHNNHHLNNLRTTTNGRITMELLMKSSSSSSSTPIEINSGTNSGPNSLTDLGVGSSHDGDGSQSQRSDNHSDNQSEKSLPI
ncbi:Cytochrome P450 4V2 [Dermatophagoides farinae]|uniref:Cytochrome P450 4V2 n=1 Tax=Dermatophagoides farinae TaxID=6954 RepID=A0A922HPY6_DERFA|nr:Cytochrome P450 4V2 [Dermatophagoides farinae]